MLRRTPAAAAAAATTLVIAVLAAIGAGPAQAQVPGALYLGDHSGPPVEVSSRKPIKFVTAKDGAAIEYLEFRGYDEPVNRQFTWISPAAITGGHFNVPCAPDGDPATVNNGEVCVQGTLNATGGASGTVSGAGGEFSYSWTADGSGATYLGDHAGPRDPGEGPAPPHRVVIAVSGTSSIPYMMVHGAGHYGFVTWPDGAAGRIAADRTFTTDDCSRLCVSGTFDTTGGVAGSLTSSALAGALSWSATTANRNPFGTTPAAPVTPLAPKFPAKLRVLRAGVVDGRLDMLLDITDRATVSGAKLSFDYHAAGRHTKFSVPIASSASRSAGGPRARAAERQVKVSYRLPASQRRFDTGIVTVKYAGNVVVAPDEVRLRAASGKAKLVRGTTKIEAGKLVVGGTITSAASGVVRIRLHFNKTDGTAGFLYWNARISKGRWAISETLPAEAARGGQLSIQFTGYLPRKLRGEQTAKQVVA